MNMRLILFTLFILLLFPVNMSGQQTVEADVISYTNEDRVIFDRLLLDMKGKTSLPTGELMMAVGSFFLETPYVASTLEREKEILVINLRELDCMTFVENVVALTQTLKQKGPTFEHFCNNLRKLRYRNGFIGDYTDRLHYTADWLFENECRGILKDVTKEIGGEPYTMQLSFMSTHPDSYKQLKGNSERIRIIAEKEKEINIRSFYYISEDKIDSCGNGMKNGDIVCFVTTIEGLDVSHIGIVYWENEKLTFMHASSSAKKVIINKESLSEYVAKIKSNAGVIIARPQF